MENSTPGTAVLDIHNVFRHWRGPTFCAGSTSLVGKHSLTRKAKKIGTQYENFYLTGSIKIFIAGPYLFYFPGTRGLYFPVFPLLKGCGWSVWQWHSKNCLDICWIYAAAYRIQVQQGVRFLVPSPVLSPVTVPIYQAPGYAPCDYNIFQP